MTIDLSIVPLYQCNLNCKFCYLGNRRNDKSLLRIDQIKNILAKYDIRYVDIYGGEISILNDTYVDQLMDIFKDRNISLVSNGVSFLNSRWKDYFLNDNIQLSFSYDISRTNKEMLANTLKKLDNTNKKYSVICIDIDELDYEQLMAFNNMESLSIKPYSMSIDNPVKYNQRMLSIYQTLYDKYSVLFSKLESVTEYRDLVPHYFLLPNGKLYDIRYCNEKEYFCELKDCKNNISDICLGCKYYRRCFNEHYFGYMPNMSDEDCLGRKRTMEYLDGLHNIH